MEGARLSHGPMIVLFCGGRDCTPESHGQQVYADVFGIPQGSIVLHGGAKGADALASNAARHYAKDRDLHEAIVPALWGTHGKSAGPRRNAAMLKLRPDFAFAYPTGGPGTNHMVALLQRENIPVVIRSAVPA